MTQSSRPQADHITSFPAPSDPGPYSGDQWAELFRVLFTGDKQAVYGPFQRYLNQLEATDNAATEVYVDTGGGMVNGHVLLSSEKETWTVPAGPAGGRIDRVVMVENNSNVEVTQSTAAQPLLFPNDLSEYTATPGVPAYSARLAILRGNNAGALPALDQTTALYMVESARYEINNVPTISSQVDYREFCKFSTVVLDRRQGADPGDWQDPGTTNYIPGEMRMQAGAAEAQMEAAANVDNVTITFPVAFADKPIVYATLDSPVGDFVVPFTVATNSTSTTQVTFICRRTGAGDEVTFAIHWLAIGPQ